MKSALLVIDVQQSFQRRPYWQEKDLAVFLANTQALVDAAQARGIPVVQIFHESLQQNPQDPFSRASGSVQTLEGLSLAPHAVFYKTVHSSMFATNSAGVNLHDWLQAQGIDELIISGIRTEQCCETTTRHASDLGYQVRFVSDATLTFDMQHASGKRFSAQDIRERTELVLAGRFAKVVSAAAAFA